MRRTVAITAVTLALAAATAAARDGGPEEKETPGERLFLAYCAECHGADGHGNPAMVAVLKVEGHDLELDGERLRGLSDDDIRLRIALGNQVMPAFAETFDADQVDRLVDHLRRLTGTWTEAGARARRLRRGARIYARDCARCHGEDGRGDAGWRRSAGVSEGALDVTDDATAARADADLARHIELGGERMPAFASRLDARERTAVLLWLRELRERRTRPAMPVPLAEPASQ